MFFYGYYLTRNFSMTTFSLCEVLGYQMTQPNGILISLGYGVLHQFLFYVFSEDDRNSES